eukprot:7228152-Pyramimonas_sp.AAC.1
MSGNPLIVERCSRQASPCLSQSCSRIRQENAMPRYVAERLACIHIRSGPIVGGRRSREEWWCKA